MDHCQKYVYVLDLDNRHENRVSTRNSEKSQFLIFFFKNRAQITVIEAL